MAQLVNRNPIRPITHSLLLAIIFLASCKPSPPAPQPTPPPATGPAYPATYGVYVLDGGAFTRLPGHSPGADSLDAKYRTFSSDASFLVFEPVESLGAITINDWKSLGQPQMLQHDVIVKPVLTHQHMTTVLPKQPLDPGLYTIEIGGRQHDYQFGIQTPDTAAYWRNVLLEDPTSWQACNHLGAIIYSQGDIKGALDLFRHSIRLNPNNPESRNNLGLALCALQQPAGAIPEFQAAIKLYDNPVMDTNLANAYEQAGQYDDAIKQYYHALASAPRIAIAHCNLGFALMKEGKLDNAIFEFRKALQLDPTLKQAQSYLDQVLQAKGATP